MGLSTVRMLWIAVNVAMWKTHGQLKRRRGWFWHRRGLWGLQNEVQKSYRSQNKILGI